MGFRFSIEHANWLAHVLQPSGPVPELAFDFEGHHALEHFLETASRNFYGSQHSRREFATAINEARAALAEMAYPYDNRESSRRSDALTAVRKFFQDVPWIALLLPSGSGDDVDSALTSPNFLGELVGIHPGDPGLILQLEQIPDEDHRIELGNVFPSFRIALANATRWPGVLLWTPHRDSAFLALPTDLRGARRALGWIFSHLAVIYGTPNLDVFQRQYGREFPGHAEHHPLHIIHLSDLHLGSRLAQRRMPRVKQLIRQLADELGDGVSSVPVVTGDLMDTPNDRHLDSLRDFIEFLHGIGSEDPVIVLGNHDVRRGGWLTSRWEQALRIETDRVRWFDRCRVGLACFNSVRSGQLARGHIDETEFLDVGQALDREPERASGYVLAALLHHHPIPVTRPPWHRREWYEKLLGSAFERTEELENAETFMRWLDSRRIGVVLHGHKHIPRADVHAGVTVVGCGSSVGKVGTTARGTTYISMNIVSIDSARGKVSCRLRAERIPGGGLGADDLHEAVLRARTFSGRTSRR